MKRRLVVAALAVAACSFGQGLDFSSLDKLEGKATEVNKISLDETQIRAALQMIPDMLKKGNEEQFDGLKKLISGLKSIEVRSFTFDNPADFTDSDLNSVRSQMGKLKHWSKIVDSKEKGEHSEIFMHTEDDHAMGLGIINKEANELTVVFINGPLKLSDLSKLGGIMGIPNIQLGPGGRH